MDASGPSFTVRFKILAFGIFDRSVILVLKLPYQRFGRLVSDTDVDDDWEGVDKVARDSSVDDVSGEEDDDAAVADCDSTDNAGISNALPNRTLMVS